MGRYIVEDENGNRYIEDDGDSSSAFSPEPQLGPDYEQSIGGNIYKSASEFLPALGHAAKDTWNFINPFDSLAIGDNPSGPLDTISRAGVGRTAEVGGGLAAGTAGALGGAALGAGWGSVLGPLGTIGGGVVGGGLGFGAGLLGFDLANDTVDAGLNLVMEEQQGGFKPVDRYAKDFAYNATQAALMGGAGEAAVRPITGGARLVGDKLGLTDASIERRVVDRLNTVTPDYAAQIDAATTAGAGDPFINYKSLGELLDNNTLRVEQRSLAKASAEQVGKSLDATAARNDAHLRWLDEIDNSQASVADVQGSIRKNIEDRVLAKEAEASLAKEDVDSALGELKAPIDPGEFGALTRERMLSGEQSIDAQISNAFNNIGDGAVDMTIARQTASELLPKYFKEVGAQPNPELLKLIEDLDRPLEPTLGANGKPIQILGANGEPITKPKTYTMQDVQALRSNALKIAKSDPRSGAVAGQIAKALEQVGDEAVKIGTVTAEQAANWDKGKSLRFQKGEVFEGPATPARAILATDPYGHYKLPESAIPAKVWRPGVKGTREAIINYKQTVGATDAALEPLYQYATKSFSDYVIKDGLVDSKKAKKWLSDHATSLSELPELRSQLSNVHTRQQFLNEKLGDLKKTKAETENSALKYFLKADPESAISAMLSGRDMIKRTVSLTQFLKANDADAVAGLRRGIIEHIKKKTFREAQAGGMQEALASGQQFKGSVMGGTLANELARIRPALERSKIFTESQLKSLDDLYNDQVSQLSIDRARAGSGSDTAQNISVLRVLTNIASSKFLTNHPAGKFLAGMLIPALRTIPQGRFIAKLEEAILNPRIARDLQNKANARNMAKTSAEVFKAELEALLGPVTVSAALGAGVGAAAKSQTVVNKKSFPKQYEVTAKKSFPTTDELLSPVAPGVTGGGGGGGESVYKPVDVKKMIEGRSAETKSRIAAESSNNPFALSNKGAQGLSQLMPGTAQEIAAELGEEYIPAHRDMDPETLRASIEQNIRFGEYYYNKMLKRFGDPKLARAAYNAGPGNLTKAIRSAGQGATIDMILARLPMPEETVPYVNRIEKGLG